MSGLATDLETTMATVRDAVEFALDNGVSREDMEAALVEVATDVRMRKPLTSED